MLSTLGSLVVLISFLLFWIGLGWLIFSLFRERKLRKPIGSILLGIVLLPMGVVLVFSGSGTDDRKNLSEPPPDTLGATRSNPVPRGSSVTHENIEVTIFEMVRGWDQENSDSIFASPPDDGYEWVVVRLLLRNVGEKDLTENYSSTSFRITGARGVIYDELFTPDTNIPLGSGEFFGGGEVVGDIVQQVHVDDDDLVLIYSPIFEGSTYLSLE